MTSLRARDKIETDYWMIGKFARKLLLQGQFVRQLQEKCIYDLEDSKPKVLERVLSFV